VSIVASALYQVSEFTVNEVPYQARIKAVLSGMGYGGLVNTVRIDWTGRMVERKMIFRVVVGEERTCCHLMEGMILTV
jgi:hypothetical protein